MKSEEVVEVSKEASFILILSASIAVLSVHVAAWQTQLRRHLWLQQFDVLEVTRYELLEAPISPDGLFGTCFHSIVDAMKRQRASVAMSAGLSWHPVTVLLQKSQPMRLLIQPCWPHRMACTPNNPPSEPSRKQARRQ